MNGTPSCKAWFLYRPLRQNTMQLLELPALSSTFDASLKKSSCQSRQLCPSLLTTKERGTWPQTLTTINVQSILTSNIISSEMKLRIRQSMCYRLTPRKMWRTPSQRYCRRSSSIAICQSSWDSPRNCSEVFFHSDSRTWGGVKMLLNCLFNMASYLAYDCKFEYYLLKVLLH